MAKEKKTGKTLTKDEIKNIIKQEIRKSLYEIFSREKKLRSIFEVSDDELYDIINAGLKRAL